ncbi:MAG: helix-turn-helix transcriptional regulator [Sandaracinaceae bacterium]
MRRADRLFRIIQLLRGRRRAVTAKTIAAELEVSERTIYRDIRDLVSSGTPIEGAAGVGYSIKKSYDLPPLMFDEEEIQALVLGARVAAAFGDVQLARAAERVLSKVEGVLPKSMRPLLGEAALYAPRPSASDPARERLLVVRTAMVERRKLSIAYEDRDGDATERVVWPLGLFFWGSSWTLTAWCELRVAFRNFRVDRMREARPLPDVFPESPGRTLSDYLTAMGVADELMPGA